MGLLIRFLRVFVFSMLVLFFSCQAHGYETGASLEELHFRLNEDFFVNKEACVIPTMTSSFVLPQELARIVSSPQMNVSDGWVSRARKDTRHFVIGERLDQFENRWHHWSQQSAVRELKQKKERRKEKHKLRERRWKEKFIEKHKELLKRRKGSFACIIMSRDTRLRCCTKRFARRGTRKRRDFIVSVCMNLVQKYADVLKSKGTMLCEKDEDKLDAWLHEIFQRMAKDTSEHRIRGTFTGGKKARRSEPDDEKEQRSIKDQRQRQERHRKKGRWEQVDKNKKNSKQHMHDDRKKTTPEGLAKFLVAMKNIEYTILAQQGGFLKSEDKDLFYAFLESFAKCYRDGKTGVFYHAVEERWLSCGPVGMGTAVKAYCSDLAALNPAAPELKRKPILKWDSGACKPIQEYMEGVSDSFNVTARKKANQKKGRGSAKYVTVDLLYSPCSKADLARACNAMCCDTVLGASYLCRTENLECIG